jgi:hypothetical protein
MHFLDGKSSVLKISDELPPALRRAGRIACEKEAARRAQDNLPDLHQKINELQNQFDQKINSLRFEGDLTRPEIFKIQVNPRKSDILIQRFGMNSLDN